MAPKPRPRVVEHAFCEVTPESSRCRTIASRALAPSALAVRHRGGMDVPAVAAVVRNGPAAPVIGAAAAVRTAGGHPAGHEQLAGSQPDDGPAEKERRTGARRVEAAAGRSRRRHRPSPKERGAADRAAEEASGGDEDGERQVHPNGRRPEATHTRLLWSPRDDFEPHPPETTRS